MSVYLFVLQFFEQYTTQLFIGYLLFAVHFPRRKYFWFRFVPLAALFLSFPYWLGYYIPCPGVRWLTLSFFLYFLLNGAVMFACFRITWKQALFFATAAYAMQHGCEMFTWTVSAAFPENWPRAMVSSVDLLIRIAVYIAYYFVFARKIRSIGEDSRFNIRNFSVVALSVITVSVVYVLSMYVSFRHWNSLATQIYAMCCCWVLLFFQFGLFDRSEIKEKNEQFRRMLALEHEQNRLSKENVEAINIKCHDLKHRIADIRRSSEAGILEERLKDLEREALIYDSFVHTGNAALDIVLTEKKFLCERYGIKFTCVADGRELANIAEEDIFSLFCNALDNAIESAKKAPPEKRLIALNMETRGKLLVVHIDNYCAEKLVFEDGLPQTTKEDKLNHGFGVRSIRYISEKYGGTMIASQQGEFFCLNVLLPLSEPLREAV